MLDVPFLLATQLESFTQFLQAEVPAEQRRTRACRPRSRRSSRSSATAATPASSSSAFAGEPTFDVKECQQRGLTFASALRAKVRLVIMDREAPDTVKEVKEQEVLWARFRS